MTGRLRAITIRPDIETLEAKAGPTITDYEYPLDGGAVYEWVPGNSDAVDNWARLTHSGGTSGRWVRKEAKKKGDDLADAATETITAGGKPLRVLPDGLSQNGVLTLATTNAGEGAEIRVTSRNTAAFTYAIVNGGAGGGTLVTFASATPSWADFYFNGTNWELTGGGAL